MNLKIMPMMEIIRHEFLRKRENPRKFYAMRYFIDGFNYRVWHYKNYHMMKIGSHFVGQKRNKANCISLTIQCLNQVFENKEQLVNMDTDFLVNKSDFRA